MASAALFMFLEPSRLVASAMAGARGVASTDSQQQRGSSTAGAARAERPGGGAVPPLAEIFREHAPFVWRGLRRLGVPESDVEDVCQEVFVVVHRKLGDFEGRSSLRTWIYGICARAERFKGRFPGSSHTRRLEALLGD